MRRGLRAGETRTVKLDQLFKNWPRIPNRVQSRLRTVGPPDTHFRNLKSKLSRQRDNFDIESKASASYVRENGLCRACAKELKSALRVRYRPGEWASALSECPTCSPANPGLLYEVLAAWASPRPNDH